MKPLFILEYRERSGAVNRTENIVGIFTSPQKAQNWIRENQDFDGKITKEKLKKRHYALCVFETLNDSGGSLVETYNLYGDSVENPPARNTRPRKKTTSCDTFMG